MATDLQVCRIYIRDTTVTDGDFTTLLEMEPFVGIGDQRTRCLSVCRELALSMAGSVAGEAGSKVVVEAVGEVTVGGGASGAGGAWSALADKFAELIADSLIGGVVTVNWNPESENAILENEMLNGEYRGPW